MTNNKPQINSYEDLLDEKKRLKNNIRMRKAGIGSSFSNIKDELNPLKAVSGTAKRIFNADHNSPLIGLGVAKASDFLLNKFLLRRAGWLTRLVLPFVVKKVSTYLIANKASDKIAGALHESAAFVRETDAELNIIPDQTKVAIAGTTAGNKMANKLRLFANKIRG